MRSTAAVDAIYIITVFIISFSGYGAGGRLGIGGIDSVSQPTLLASIQHVFITKVNIL